MRLVLPRLYVLLDASLLTVPQIVCAEQLAEAGVRLLQYRNKRASSRELYQVSQRLASILCPRGITFFVNDRPDVAWLAAASGVHVGQEDLSVLQVRAVVGADKKIGVSTHTMEQFQRAAESSADYIAVGPIFSTSSKEHPDPVLGTEFIRRIRVLTDKPIVAIGGITLQRAGEVISAGADSVAVIRDILRAVDPGARARQYIELLETAKPAAAV